MVEGDPSDHLRGGRLAAVCVLAAVFVLLLSYEVGSVAVYEEPSLGEPFETTSPTIIRLSRRSTPSKTGSSTSEGLRLRRVAENSHRLLSRRQRTQGGGRGLSTPRRIRR